MISAGEGQLSQGSSTSSVPTAKLTEQFREIQAQNAAVEGQIQAQRRQFDEARMAQKAASARGGGGGPGSSSPEVTPANQEEIRKLQAEVAQVDESLKKKEQENESLKSRIRKLAVA